MKPILFNTEMVKAILDGRKTMTRRVCKGARELSCAMDWPIESCPYGQVGDRLWVRETFMFDSRGNIHYKAIEPDWVSKTRNKTTIRIAWKPSIHMFRKDSRITLEMIRLWVERLLDINEADARAEGFDSVEEFLFCWDKLNKKRGYGTDVNPWNWCIEWPPLSG